MDPVSLALLGGGLVLKSYGEFKANMDQADSEAQNASFYREQAEFSRLAGIRQREIFERETAQLEGEQRTGFAKGGVDSTSTVDFFSAQTYTWQQESLAIKRESDMNVRLAMLRADNAHQTAERLRDPLTNALQIGGNAITGLKSIL
jgi:hypothetical protein